MAQASEPFVTTSLDGILQDDHNPSTLRRESASSSKLPASSRRSKDTSVIMGRSQSIGESSEAAPGIIRTGSASPRRSSLISPGPALADDEDEMIGRHRHVSRSESAARLGAGE